MIPPWLAGGNPPPVPVSSRRGKASFLEKTVNAAAAFTADTVLCERHAGRDGLLQKIDPRFKLPGILALIVSVSLLRSPPAVWGGFLLALILASLSRVGCRFFIGRIFPFVFLFGAVLALPSVFNVITPGEQLWVAAELGKSREIGPFRTPEELVVTRQGLQGAVLFTGRVAASFSLALLLPLTTRWNELLRAFSAFRVPPTFILVLEMAYRYIALLVRTVVEMHEARRSRTVRYLPTGEEQRWVASRIGYLFGKSYRMSREVHDAMLARGFAGEVTTLAVSRVSWKDYMWFIAMLVVSVTMYVLDRYY